MCDLPAGNPKGNIKAFLFEVIVPAKAAITYMTKSMGLVRLCADGRSNGRNAAASPQQHRVHFIPAVRTIKTLCELVINIKPSRRSY